MIGIILDVAIIVSMLAYFEGLNEDWRDVIYPVIALQIAFLCIAYGLGAIIGYGVFALMAILTFFVLMAWCHMRIHSAIITTLLLFAVKFGWAMFISSAIFT